MFVGSPEPVDYRYLRLLSPDREAWDKISSRRVDRKLVNFLQSLMADSLVKVVCICREKLSDPRLGHRFAVILLHAGRLPGKAAEAPGLSEVVAMTLKTPTNAPGSVPAFFRELSP